MTRPKALTPPQKPAALASTDALDTNKQRTFETRETEASHLPAVHNQMFVHSRTPAAKLVTNDSLQYRA